MAFLAKSSAYGEMVNTVDLSSTENFLLQVQVLLGAIGGGIAQLVSALACHAKGRGFKSHCSRIFMLLC